MKCVSIYHQQRPLVTGTGIRPCPGSGPALLFEMCVFPSGSQGALHTHTHNAPHLYPNRCQQNELIGAPIKLLHQGVSTQKPWLGFLLSSHLVPTNPPYSILHSSLHSSSPNHRNRQTPSIIFLSGRGLEASCLPPPPLRHQGGVQAGVRKIKG